MGYQKHVKAERTVPGMHYAYDTDAGRTALRICQQKMSVYASNNVWDEQGTMSTQGVRIGTDKADFYDVEFATIVQMGCGVRVDPKTATYEGSYALTVDGSVVEKGN